MNVEKPRRTAAHFLYASYNFLYPASAICMLAGLLLLNEAMDVRAAQLRQLFILIAILQVYEFCVIGLAVYLLRRRKMVMDARLLLLLELPFLLDVAHLNAEVFGADVWAGAGINAAVFLLAAVKAIIIARALKVRWAASQWALLGASFALLLSPPGALAAMSRTQEIGAWHIYAGWWAMAIMLGLHGMWPGDRRARAMWPDVARLLRRTTTVLLYVAMMLHLVGQGWVYRVSFDAAFVAPVLLGLAIAWPRSRARKAEPALIVWHQYLLIGAAVLTSLAFGRELYREAAEIAGLVMSPLRLTLLGSALILALAAWRRKSLLHTSTAAACLLSAMLGHTVATMLENVTQMVRLLAQWLEASVPQTRRTWGIIAVSAAFALLIAGAAVSLLRSRATRRNGGHVMT